MNDDQELEKAHQTIKELNETIDLLKRVVEYSYTYGYKQGYENGYNDAWQDSWMHQY